MPDNTDTTVVQFNYSHEVYLMMMRDVPDVDIWMEGGNVDTSERDDWLDVHEHVPDNIHFGRHDNPDVEIQGQNPDIRITNNRGLTPLEDGWTVYTTETKVADDPPSGQWMLIRKGMDMDKFDAWSGDVTKPVVTTTNDIRNRRKAAHIPVHDALIDADVVYRAYGKGNDDGFLTHSALADTLREAGIYANISKTISPNALYEAMSTGMPIVTVPGYGAKDAITHGWNGYIASNPDNFVRRVQQLRENPDEARRIAENARTTVEGRYSRAEFVRRWHVLLNTQM